MSEHRHSVARILSAPIDRLVVGEDQDSVVGVEIDGWGLARQDENALSRWGLPIIEGCGLVANIQRGPLPELEDRGRSYYSLGIFLAEEIGVDSESGVVRGIPSGAEPGASFINSSVSFFVESAWRWYWVWKEVEELRFSIRQYDLLDDFLAFVVALDPPVGSIDSSFWRGMVMSWQS